MATYKKKRKISFKSIISLVLVIGTVIALGAGVSALLKNDTRKLSSTIFTRGTLDAATGEFEDSDTTIYTKESFFCKGLRIEPDFEFKGTYDVFYYTTDNVFIEAKTGLTGIYDEAVPYVSKARVVIHVDSELLNDRDFKINFWEVNRYARDLEITVNKDQNIPERISQNFTETDKALLNKSFVTANDSTEWNINSLSDSENTACSDIVTIDKTYDEYEVFIRVNSNQGSNTFIVFANESGDVIYSIYNNSTNEDAADFIVGKWVSFKFDLSNELFDTATFMRIVSPADTVIYTYGYEY